jgi:hypothetical protein
MCSLREGSCELLGREKQKGMNMKAWIVTSLAAAGLAVAGGATAADITGKTQKH